MKVHLHSIGCRLNQSEIETLGRQLLAAGHELVGETAVADKVIVNTCAVTSEAARDARSFTRRTHRQNGDAEILLTGCYATIAPDALAEVEGAGRIVVNKDKDKLIQILDPEAMETAVSQTAVYDQEPILRQFLNGTSSGLQVGNTRAFIKVQDGCDNKCTFCVTTVARGEGTSRHLGDIVAEIQALTAVGYQEAVLTGVHLGSYGRDLDNKTGLGELISAILEHTNIPRLRISSLEPWEVADGFFDLWENPRLLPHLHMPLQSGSDKILRRMARRTNRVSFRALAETAHATIPHLNLTTDIIVGFPDETDADFEASLDFVREIGFSRLHAFTYSQRPGTAASKMPNQVIKVVKKARVRQMLDLGKELSLAFHQQYVGQELNVLWENNVGAVPEGLRWAGYTDNYIRVHAIGGTDLFNKITRVRVTEATADGIVGEIVG